MDSYIRLGGRLYPVYNRERTYYTRHTASFFSETAGHMDYNSIVEKAKSCESDMVAFLRDIIAIPSESTEEKGVIDRIRREMESVGVFDKIWVDGLGSLLATVGHGPRLIAIDAHIDTVGLGHREEWEHDPYKGKVEDGYVWGRGAGDQEGAVPPMVYGAKIMKDLGLLGDEFTLLLTCTVMEEDCDGLCWQYIINEEKIRPECVVVTDSTNATILRGHRGRMEIGVEVTGRSCHGSMPHKGVNAVYKMARIVAEVEKLNERIKDDEFLGKGTITVSEFKSESPSLCAVPGKAAIHLDRRLTVGETRESAIAEIEEICKTAGVPEAKVFVKQYAREAYTGLTYPTESYFPTWCYREDAPQVEGAKETIRRLYGEEPEVKRWTFSTNGVAIAGMHGIPCVGYGPAEEDVAHTVNDRVPIEHLIRCAAFYAAFPSVYCASQPAEGIEERFKAAALTV